jgi:hypothetical protein
MEEFREYQFCPTSLTQATLNGLEFVLIDNNNELYEVA